MFVSLLNHLIPSNLDSILKIRAVTLPTKVRVVKAMVFPVVMYGCESWTIKETDCWRIYAFELWCFFFFFLHFVFIIACLLNLQQAENKLGLVLIQTLMF